MLLERSLELLGNCAYLRLQMHEELRLIGKRPAVAVLTRAGMGRLG
jgi:hypothetical protein